MTIWKLAVVGSRHWTNKITLSHILNYWISQRESIYDGVMIVTGGAGGADTMAKEYAEKNGIEIRVHNPDWKQYGKAAGPIRNSMIVSEADEMIAFIKNGLENKGTWDAVHKMLKELKQVHLIPGN